MQRPTDERSRGSRSAERVQDELDVVHRGERIHEAEAQDRFARPGRRDGKRDAVFLRLRQRPPA